jgi:hypothetical protein
MTPAQRNSLAARIAAARIQPLGYLEWADMTAAERESATQEAARWLDDILAAGLDVVDRRPTPAAPDPEPSPDRQQAGRGRWGCEGSGLRGDAGVPDGVPVLLVGVPAGAWEYMKDGKTHHFDLTRIGIPIKMMFFGAADHGAAMKLMEDAQRASNTPALDLRREDFSIKPR